MKIAALYVDDRGPYIGRADVDAWPKPRNAKLYAGPLSVVAHPDCGPWSKLRHMCTKQDRSCGPHAVHQVIEFGGVLPVATKLVKRLTPPAFAELLISIAKKAKRA